MMIVSCQRRKLNGNGMLLFLSTTLVVLLLGVVSGFHEMSPLTTTTFPRDNIFRDSRITTNRKHNSFVSLSCRYQDVLTFSSSTRTNSMARIRPTTRCSDKGLCATNNGLGGDGSSDDGYDNSDELSRTSSKQQQQQQQSSIIEEINSINEFISFLQGGGKDEPQRRLLVI